MWGLMSKRINGRMKRNGSLFLLAALAFCLAPLRAQTPPYTGMVSFGDSLSDTGNMNYIVSGGGELEQLGQWLTGFDPNNYYNYRFSNGPVWVDQLYTSLGFGPLGSMAPNAGVDRKNGTNFSFAGSRSGTGTYGLIFPNLQTQVSTYTAQLAESNPALPAPATTLFTIWSGANDVFDYVESSGTSGITPQDVANNIATSITSLYADGGRYFLVPNLPPIGETPSYINDPVKRDMANTFVDTYNGLLDSSLDTLLENLDGVVIIKLDINQLFRDIEADPALYGFTNMTDTAYIRYGSPPYEPTYPPYGTVVPNPDGYFYWDAVHGTAAVNTLIGQLAYEAVVPEPSALLYLFLAGLGVLAFRRKSFSRTSSIIGHPK